MKKNSISDDSLSKASGGVYDLNTNMINHISSNDPDIQKGIDSYYHNKPSYDAANEMMAQQNRGIDSALNEKYSNKNNNNMRKHDLYLNRGVK